jgi:hypothetical protein
VLVARQLYFALVYDAQHRQTLRSRLRHRLLVHAVNTTPATLALLQGTPIGAKFIFEPVTVVVYDDSATSPEAQVKALVLQAFAKYRGPCVAIVSTCLIEGGVPDLFMKPVEVAAANIGREMKVGAICAMTVDGANCHVVSERRSGYVGRLQLQEAGPVEVADVQDLFVPSSRTFRVLQEAPYGAALVGAKTVLGGTSVSDRDMAKAWHGALGLGMNSSLFCASAGVVEALGAHLQYGWQNTSPPSHFPAFISRNRPPAVSPLRGQFFTAVTFRALSKMSELGLISLVQQECPNGRLVSPQYSSGGASADALDDAAHGSVGWQPRRMCATLPVGSGWSSVLDAMAASRMQAQAIALQPCSVERVKLLLALPPADAVLSAEAHPFMALHADGRGICPVDDEQHCAFPPAQHFESHITVKMAGPAAGAADTLAELVRQHGARFVRVPFVISAPPTENDRRRHPLRLVVQRAYGCGYTTAMSRLRALLTALEGREGSLGVVTTVRPYYVIHDSSFTLLSDGLHDWETEGDEWLRVDS